MVYLFIKKQGSIMKISSKFEKILLTDQFSFNDDPDEREPMPEELGEIEY